MDDGYPDITIQRFQQILKSVFELLWFEPQGLYVSEILQYMKKTIVFTDFETGVYPFAPDIPRYEAIIRIGTIPFEKVGWLEKTKNGRWYITIEGRKACLAFKNSEKFFEISVQMFDEWKAKENQRLALLETDPHFDPVEYSWGQIERYFQVLDIKDIRILVTSLLKALDCHIQWTGPVTANDSMEMLCSMDPLGIKSPHLHIHITKRCQKTSMEDLTTYIHDLESSSIGIYFSFGGFEEGVKEYALNQKKPTLRLIDLEGFVELWVENIKKIDQEGYAKFPLRPVHFLTIPGNSQLSIDPQGSI